MKIKNSSRRSTPYHSVQKRYNLVISVGSVLTVFILGLAAYDVFLKKFWPTGYPLNRATKLLNHNIGTENPSFLYVVNEQRRKNDDPRDWKADYFSLIKYNPVLDKKDVMYEISSQELFEESGIKKDCCVSPQFKKYGKNKLAIFGPSGFKARVIDILGKEVDTFIKNDISFYVSSDENFIAYNNFLSEGEPSLRIRNLRTGIEKVIKLDDILKGKEQNIEGLYLAPESEWVDHSIQFSIFDSLLPHSPKRAYWEFLGDSSVFQYDIDLEQIKQVSNIDNSRDNSNRSLDPQGSFEYDKFKYDRWVVFYNGPHNPQYIRILDTSTGSIKELGRSVSLRADEKTVERSDGTIMGFTVIDWFPAQQ